MTAHAPIRRLAVVLAATGAALLLGSGAALALINPRFTPNDLVEQSNQILVVKLAKPGANNVVPMTPVRALKGAKPDKAIALNLAAAAQQEWAKKIGEMAAERGETPALLFVGERREQGQAEGEGVKGAVLQIDRAWVVLEPGQDGAWNMVRVDDKLQGTWDGGSDMMLRAIEHILKHPQDLVPVSVNCDWAGTKKPGKVEGQVASAAAVDLDGKGAFVLHVASAGGDRLFGWDAGKKDFADLTAARKLGGRSRASAWGDFSGDGKLDLASWDGAALTVHLQAADGTFGGKPADAGFKPEGGCLSLAALDTGAGKRAGLLATTAKGPVLLRPDGDGFKAEPLPVPEGDLGQASACLVADLDADGWADVLAPFEKAALIFRGKAAGAFEAAKKVEALGTTKGPATCSAGDYDADGLLDVFMIGPGCCHLWNNRGGLTFAESFGHSGEMCYTAQPSAGFVSQSCDINNDGLPDLFIAFADEHPHMYFNRGYRSFGKALSLVWENAEFTREAGAGQRGAVVADLTGDGAQDMALVHADGSVQVWVRGVAEGDDNRPLGAQVLLGASAGTAGPATVTAWNDRRPLGALSVSPGSPGGFFGLPAAGTIKLRWQLPGGKPQEKTLEIEGKVRNVFLGTDAK
ncbi:MAG TPA: VCBS repeat-containing protein [Planctomycetota bacterium]|nr:VCBS repeat-containing protein [Planctomycetota bacterium]